MFLVVRTPRTTVGSVSHTIGGHTRSTGEAGIATTGNSSGCFCCISGIRLGLHWKLRTLEKPFGCINLKPFGVQFEKVSF